LKRLSSTLLVVLGFVLVLSPVLSASAATTTAPSHIGFSNLALGPCLILGFTDNTMSTLWFSDATGSTAFGGYANVVSYSVLTTPGSLQTGYTYVADVKSALGFASASWCEDGVQNRLSILIYAVSTSQMYAQVYSATHDQYQAGIWGPSLPTPPYENTIAPTLLDFQGTYTIGSCTHCISGYIADGGGNCVPSTGFTFVWLVFEFDDKTISIWWDNQPVSASNNPFGVPIAIPAANTCLLNTWTY